MINDVNHLILIGTLGEDAKLTQTKNQEPMVLLNVATNSEWIDGNEKRKKTLWTKVFFFGNKALACEGYKKGMKVHITAEVSEKAFSEGESKTYKTVVNGNSVWVADLGASNRPSPELITEELPF